MNADTFDLAIIGGGPAGYSAALLAAKYGKKVVLFESDHVGGTCLNVGCIPTKYLADKASVIDRIRQLSEEKIFDQAGRFSYRKIQQGKQETVEKLVSGVENLLKSAKVTVIKGEAKLIDHNLVECNSEKYDSLNVLISTGSVSWFPDIPGSEGNIIGSTEALALEKVPGSTVIIGGGVIGLELASIFSSFGSKIVVVELLDELLPKEDRNAITEMRKLLVKKGITITTSAKNLSISVNGGKKKVEFEKSGEKLQAEADCIIGATGRRASLKGIDAKKLGLQLDAKGNIIVDGNMKTNIPGVYAAGDVVGGWQLAHAAYKEAEIAVNGMFGKEGSVDETPMPRCVYTNPPVASVGITIQEASAAGKECIVGSFPYAANGMALAEGARDGTAWVIIDKKTGEVLGAHIVGTGSTELIGTAAMAIATKTTASQWAEMIVAHPTLSEILHEAAMSCVGRSVHKFR